ncbi:hypothetical protein CRP01_06710 [Flavilitoribacter nigricans DSM 23189 = NBRC 102662]|uniref:Uncharacterized protein n=1 Tax=Flavilitoribacter nigricans (strain ATCC 23147 / DSM 23189 / NBRC 102662 / NCIMB 1420 / SS-2) TaxID=1122177 RepID=A0A2D0NG08_FLAN2|nr:hypothetical protein CRP01_06710 [Flavilitoribacter nigricans DSM 23189 = NBRC 102662]
MVMGKRCKGLVHRNMIRPVQTGPAPFIVWVSIWGECKVCAVVGFSEKYLVLIEPLKVPHFSVFQKK